MRHIGYLFSENKLLFYWSVYQTRQKTTAIDHVMKSTTSYWGALPHNSFRDAWMAMKYGYFEDLDAPKVSWNISPKKTGFYAGKNRYSDIFHHNNSRCIISSHEQIFENKNYIQTVPHSLFVITILHPMHRVRQ